MSTTGFRDIGAVQHGINVGVNLGNRDIGAVQHVDLSSSSNIASVTSSHSSLRSGSSFSSSLTAGPFLITGHRDLGAIQHGINIGVNRGNRDIGAVQHADDAAVSSASFLSSQSSTINLSSSLSVPSISAASNQPGNFCATYNDLTVTYNDLLTDYVGTCPSSVSMSSLSISPISSIPGKSSPSQSSSFQPSSVGQSSSPSSFFSSFSIVPPKKKGKIILDLLEFP